jgi:hypothetical protein
MLLAIIPAADGHLLGLVHLALILAIGVTGTSARSWGITRGSRRRHGALGEPTCRSHRFLGLFGSDFRRRRLRCRLSRFKGLLASEGCICFLVFLDLFLGQPLQLGSLLLSLS